MQKANRMTALIKAITVTCELTRTEFTPPAAEFLALELAQLPEAQVAAALAQCAREVPAGRLTLAEITTRIQRATQIAEARLDPRCSGILAGGERCSAAARFWPGRSRSGLCWNCEKGPELIEQFNRRALGAGEIA